ncbi:MAG TPA: Ig-like domain-containing protein, partial [Gammaproteobacteria bacterium]
MASPQLDVRVSAPLVPDFTRAEYEIRVTDCTRLQLLTVSHGAEVLQIPPEELTAIVDGGCLARLVATGAGADRVSVSAAFNDGTSLQHEELFRFETERPALTIDDVSVTATADGQQLIVTLNASDDVDISYLDVQATGLRASDLRAAGGVVAKARDKAFAASAGSVRLFPEAGQQSFVLGLPLNTALDAAAIMSDGVVLIDATAVDASGNQRSESALRFTGSSVSEAVLGLSASPANIVFNDLLQTAVILPSVDFQFRGVTPLPGAGSGVSYASSNPELVGVTAGGVAYPLAPTAGEAVSITVSYPGAAAVTIPVVVDPTRQLLHLEVEGLNADGNFEIPRLNAALPFPPVFARFDDGSRVDIGEQFAVEFVPGEGSEGVLDVAADGKLVARAVINDSAPLNVTARLAAQPAIDVVVPVVARDAVPLATLTAPGTVEAGETMVVKAGAEDDMRVAEVRLMLDGTLLATLDRPPYEVTLAATEQMIDRQLRWQAVAIDSAGQQGISPLATTTVVAKREKPVPDLDWENPVELQRVIEGAPMRLQLARKLDMEAPGPRVSHVDFFMDGASAGTANFPRIEQREEPDPATGEMKPVFFELWYF